MTTSGEGPCPTRAAASRRTGASTGSVIRNARSLTRRQEPGRPPPVVPASVARDGLTQENTTRTRITMTKSHRSEDQQRSYRAHARQLGRGPNSAWPSRSIVLPPRVPPRNRRSCPSIVPAALLPSRCSAWSRSRLSSVKAGPGIALGRSHRHQPSQVEQARTPRSITSRALSGSTPVFLRLARDVDLEQDRLLRIGARELGRRGGPSPPNG